MTERTALKQAVLVRRYKAGGKLGDAALYWLNPPIFTDHWDPRGETFDHVLLSTRGYTEMYPADSSGRVLGWSDITTQDWSVDQVRTHEGLLAAEGYELVTWGEVRR